MISVHQLMSSLTHFHLTTFSHILLPIRVNSNAKTLINNIFSIMALPNILSGNLTATSSDHFPQFLLAPNILLNSSSTLRSNKYERDWSRFDQEHFILDYLSIGWDNLLLVSNMNIDNLCKTFIEKFDSLLN